MPLLIQAPAFPCIVKTELSGAFKIPPASMVKFNTSAVALIIGTFCVVDASGITTLTVLEGEPDGVQLSAVV